MNRILMNPLQKALDMCVLSCPAVQSTMGSLLTNMITYNCYFKRKKQYTTPNYIGKLLLT